ncbi:MAG: GH1 family beta-glucosidase, partial [Thermoflexales bacterium]|nr:GH1 family beta-glucosidase [Thermoflexales bacterium]
RFPADFVWGTATSAYQVEGAARQDGRGSSIWDDFCRIKGAVSDGSDGSVACDHYNRYQEDVALMRALGLRAYRFSIAWPRVLPEGRGAVNPKGLDFYQRLVDALLEAGIRPFVTLYHWDLPSALNAQGGWTVRESAGWFADYAALMVRVLGDRVKDWITLNEPWCSAYLGYELGVHAPGYCSRTLAARAAHHLLLAHGMAAQAIRAASDGETRVGITLNFNPALPASNSNADRHAAEAAPDWMYELFAVPILTGAYPPRALEVLSGHVEIRPGDLALIAARNDFLGVNYYSARRVSAEHGEVDDDQPEYTLMGWAVRPQGLHTLLLKLHRDTRGRLPIYITENGASFEDTVIDGRVHDARRIAYLRAHLEAVYRAIQDGVDVRGYFVWSLLDNFEWSFGYRQFFGLVHVNYATQQRVIKDSGFFYRDVIANNGLTED